MQLRMFVKTMSCKQTQTVYSHLENKVQDNDYQSPESLQCFVLLLCSVYELYMCCYYSWATRICLKWLNKVHLQYTVLNFNVERGQTFNEDHMSHSPLSENRPGSSAEFIS